ncbi:MAG: hypothetical protein HN815_07150 [Candidatus Marinimicrobia bacterium]|jgi:hypothetical protein|nr:hypothetical protein [Candidatus Neomarinimicrobiota bacterium]MBT7373751.1 hypothetical protein [Candidatus Neomarinimicrobiota bacterium]
MITYNCFSSDTEPHCPFCGEFIDPGDGVYENCKHIIFVSGSDGDIIFDRNHLFVESPLESTENFDSEEMKEKLTKLDDHHIQFEVSISHRHEQCNYVFREDIDE